MRALSLMLLCAASIAWGQDPAATPQPGLDEQWEQPIPSTPPLVTPEEEKPPPPPAPKKEEPPKDAPKLQPPPPEPAVRPGVRFQLNGGMGFASVPARSYSGVGLFGDAVTAFRMNDLFSFRLRVGLAASEWQRTVAFWGAGIAVGSWTAGAYVTVTNWWTTGDPKWGFFKFMASLGAYVFLSLGFIAAGVLFVISPLAAATFLEAGPSFSVHYTRNELDLYLETGVSGMLYAIDAVGFDVGWGPLVGVGMRIGPIGVATHVMWSPGELNGTRSSMFAGGATVSVGY